MLTVFLVTAEAHLGEGKMEQMALVCLWENVRFRGIGVGKFFAVKSQNSVKVTLTSINSEGRIKSLEYIQSFD